MHREAGGRGGKWDDNQAARARAPSESGCAQLGNRSTLFLISLIQVGRRLAVEVVPDGLAG